MLFIMFWGRIYIYVLSEIGSHLHDVIDKSGREIHRDKANVHIAYIHIHVS
jgi:hypothetical protein